MPMLAAYTEHSGDMPSIYTARILVVDDNEFNLAFIGKTLEAFGFSQIITARNGQEALEKTKELHPDIVILDLMMPVMDGFTYCREVRSLSPFVDLPVIVQTGLEDAEDRNAAFVAGATDLVTKPINAGELHARIRIHLEKQHLLNDLRQYRARVETELNHARNMQDLLMPTTHELHGYGDTYGLDIASYFQPSSELGGDFWGVIPLSRHEMAIYISDFSGHGVTAALNTFRLHTIMREITTSTVDAGTYLTSLNKKLCGLLSPGQFATMFFGIINTQENTLCYSAASHPEPMIFSPRSGTNRVLDGKGLPLGVLRNAEYATLTEPFARGDMLLLYSDALIETPDESGTMLSTEALSRLLASCPAAPSPDVYCNFFVEHFYQHAAHAPTDDLTLNFYYRK